MCIMSSVPIILETILLMMESKLSAGLRLMRFGDFLEMIGLVTTMTCVCLFTALNNSYWARSSFFNHRPHRSAPKEANCTESNKCALQMHYHCFRCDCFFYFLWWSVPQIAPTFQDCDCVLCAHHEVFPVTSHRPTIIRAPQFSNIQ